MTFPDDLPRMVEYRVGNTVLVALPRRAVTALGSGGRTNAPEVCPQIPYGATGWRLPGEEAWKDLEAIPADWLPFLERQRPGPMDFRPETGGLVWVPGMTEELEEG